MTSQTSSTAYPLSKEQRRARKIGLGILFCLLIPGIMSIPFVSPYVYWQGIWPPETQTMVVLGKVCAVLAASLVLFQYVLSGRVHFLDRIFSLNALLNNHRIIAVVAAFLATLHPVFIFGSKAREIHSFHLDHWPLYLGPVVLLGLWMTVIAGLGRKKLKIPFQFWWFMHRLAVFSLVILLSVHFLIMGSDFSSGWPKYLAFLVLALYACFFLWNKTIKPVKLRKNRYSVSEIVPMDESVTAVKLKPKNGNVFSYAPGQFSFVKFFSKHVTGEEHHFTLSSTPTRSDSIIFTIKSSGDFTSRINRLSPGDEAILDGPYGLFNHLAWTSENDPLICIAGGIGITPFLSMMRYMADTGDSRTIHLVWSNKREKDIVAREEMNSLQEKLSGLEVTHVLTRQEDFQGMTGHLDQSKLEKLFGDMDRTTHVFICGPPPMMNAVNRALISMGFDSGRIHMERFSL